MVFTEQQLQVKKLVDVQQDIEIDALNDGVSRVNSNVVKNSQDISAQSDRISDAETRIGNLEATDTQILNTIGQMQTSTSQAITDAVSAVMTSIGNQVTTEKVVAGDINIPNINSENPVESNKVLGYDSQGNIIPVEATFELGVPSNAAYLKTDENANVEAGVPDSTVTEDSTNLVTSGAVYDAIDSAADTLDSKIDSAADTLDNKIDFTAGGLSSRIDAIENGQSLVIQNEPYQNKAVNKPGMRTIMYDPSDDESYWSDVNLVPPMDENTIGKFLTNNNNIPQWADVPNELPEYTTSDDGKSLKVKYNNGAAELEWEKDIPDYASSDVGKVLTVKDNNGSTELGWESEKELPDFTTSQLNKVLTVKDNNGDVEVAWENTQSTLPSTTGNANKVLTVNGTGDGVEWKANNTLSASDHSTSKSYLVKGAGADGDVAHYLRGDGSWGEVPNTLPDFGSTDAGKVLAINNNGTDPEWVANEPILPTASSSTLGGVKSATTGTTPYRDYNVQVNSNGTMKVNVPWTDTLPPILATTQYSSSQGYRVRGPGEDKATTGYVLAGNGTWVALPTTPNTLGVDIASANTPVLVKYPANSKRNQSHVLAGDGTWVDANVGLKVGDSTTADNTATTTTTNGAYIKVVRNGAVIGTIKVVGKEGVLISSTSNGELEINGTVTPVLNSNNNSSLAAYTVRGPGSSKATTGYVLAGNGTWVKGVPQPTSSDYGKTLKCNSSGNLYWG